MGCEGCLTSNKAQQQELERVRKEAKEYAVQNNQTMAIYKEGNEFRHLDAREAIARGYPVVEFVSQHQ